MAKEAKKKFYEQFFTPSVIAEGMLKLIEAERGYLIDPSCGDGVFLKVALRYRRIKPFGCDIDKAYIKDLDKGVLKGHLLTGDSLMVLLDYNDTFDFSVGNPPFSAQENLITDPYILNSFVLGRGRKSQAIEILFLELFIYILKQGGWFSIILPEGIISTRSLQYVRDWLINNTQIHSIISLPRKIFNGTSSKCIILSGRKIKSNKYDKVFFASCEDVSGFLQLIGKIKKNKLKDSLPMDELLRVTDWRPEILTIKKGNVIDNWMLLSELVTLRTGFVKYGKDRHFDDKPKSMDCYRLIVARNFLPVAGLDFKKVAFFIDKNNPSFSQKAILKRGEILFVRVGVGCCGRVAVFDYNINAQADDWIHIMTPYNDVNPWYLASWIASSYGQWLVKQMAHGVGTISISKSKLLSLRVPRLSNAQENEIADYFRYAIQKNEGGWQAVLNKKFRKYTKNLVVLVPSPTGKSFYPLKQEQDRHAVAL
ncbi:MAG: N-6 DNA methylase [Candidatus Omnitrophota bacterium]